MEKSQEMITFNRSCDELHSLLGVQMARDAAAKKGQHVLRISKAGYGAKPQKL